MQFGGFMDTEKIRTRLGKMAKERGSLKRFCKNNDLPYFTLWRFANSKTGKLDHDLGQKISGVLSVEPCSTASSIGEANA